MNARELTRTIGRFPKARVLVIGDVMLDEYVWGSVERISPEAPVPVVWAQRRNFVPGGAANVAFNIRSLGAAVSLVGVTGTDSHAHLLRAALKARGVSIAGIRAEASRHTTLKTRIIAGHQQVVRVDWEHTEPLKAATNRSILAFIQRQMRSVDAVIIEDYGKGVINRALLEAVRDLARARGTVLTVDPKLEHFQYYRGVTCITPNRKELENAVRSLKLSDKTQRFSLDTDRLFTDADIDRAAVQVMEYLGLDSILVTLGEAGMRLFERSGKRTHIPTVAQEVFDVSGAGDTVISTFSLALACKASKLQAAHIANFAAGIVVGKVGTAVTTPQELCARIRNAQSVPAVFAAGGRRA